MLGSRVCARLVGVENTVVEAMDFDEVSGDLVVRVRPFKRCMNRCGICGSRSPRFDRGRGRRRWRSLDAGTTRVFLEADAPRVSCPAHGVVVAQVPWARHGAGHTCEFDAQVAWLVTQCSKRGVSELMRIAWHSVGAIIERVWEDTESTFDRFADLTRIGVDEISYKRGHKYLTVVVNHDTGRLVWAAPGRDKATLNQFFDELAASGDAAGQDRVAMISHVSADGANWIKSVIRNRCPRAVLCADPFHVVKWVTEALDTVRRQAWSAATGRRRHDPETGQQPRSVGQAQRLQHSRFSIWKNPENLTANQQVQLDWIRTSHPTLFRAYLLKEAMRTLFKLAPQEAPAAFDHWISWARRSRIPAFVDLQRRIMKHRDEILASITHGLSNGLIESVNTKIRLITRIAFGFHGPEPLIALAMLNLAGPKPSLPGRPRPTHP